LEEELASQLDAYDDLSAQLANQGKNDDAKLELEAKVALVQTLRSSLRDANAATDQLRLNLREKGDSLRHAESTIASLPRERANITKDLLEFETDLQRQRAESEAFGKELKTLKAEQGGSARLREEMAVLQRNYRSAKDTLHQAQQQLAVAVRRASELESWQKQQLKEGCVVPLRVCLRD
jgi:chromosome segregation ATPase